MNKALALALALAASFALVALGVASRRTAARQAATASSGAQDDAPAPGGLGRPLSAQDCSLRYRVAALHQLELGDEASRTRLGIGLEAECTLVPLTRSTGTTEIQGRCQGVALDLSGSSAQAFSDSARSLLEQQLETPFFFTLRPDGGVARVAIDPALDPLVAGLVRDLIAGLQRVQSAPGKDVWSVEETDATGPHRANYRRLDGSTLAKTRRDYRAAPRADGTPALSGQVDATLGLSDDDTVDRVDARGHFEVRADLGLPTTVDTSLRLQLVARGAAGVSDEERVALLQLRARFGGTPLDAVGASAAAQTRRDQKLLAGATLSDLVDQWDELPLDDDDEGFDRFGQARARLQARLEALFRSDAQSAAAAAGLLTRGALEDELAATLTAALGAVGSPAAQAALLQVGNASDALQPQRVQALMELGLVATPDAATLQGLGALLDESSGALGATAALALGNAAAGARASGSADGTDAFAQLARALAAAQTVDEQLTLWLALENTGDERLIALVRGSLDDPEPALRAAAAGALRLTLSPSATATLLDLSGAADAVVAQAAARALRERPALPFLSALATTLTEAPVAAARHELVVWLARDVGEDAVAALLARVAAEDPDAGVRDVATQLLATG